MNSELKIDKEKCSKCGLCVKHCDCGFLTVDEEGYPKFDKNKEKFCLKCQHCLASCPNGAFSIFGKSSADSVKVKDYVNPDDMLGLIKTRRSCRHYKNENLDKETLSKLKNMLAWAPTGCNYHGLHFSVVEDVEVMASYKECTYKNLKKIHMKTSALIH